MPSVSRPLVAFRAVRLPAEGPRINYCEFEPGLWVTVYDREFCDRGWAIWVLRQVLGDFDVFESDGDEPKQDE